MDIPHRASAKVRGKVEIMVGFCGSTPMSVLILTGELRNLDRVGVGGLVGYEDFPGASE